ncbi:hypothetical protein AB1285_27420 [Microbacterium sp. NRRL B-14842]|uniref:hypothetical protein n=1 Tax=Microbacterium sp. NRRL B-14842 TaxID=3162881 RepID=UPI003D26932B
MTAASATRRNPIVEAFRDWACLETFPLTAWACDEWVHSIDPRRPRRAQQPR